MSKESVYKFLKRTYSKHLVLFAKNNKIFKYSLDYDIYREYKNVSYIIVYNNMLIRKDYKNNNYEAAIIKYNIINILKKMVRK